MSAEVARRFPESWDQNTDNSDLPYCAVGDVVDWLANQPTLESAIIRRVVDFAEWCRSQPPGVSAEDDIGTIYAVAFLENLFAHDRLLPLIPRLTTRAEFLANRDYLVRWIGKDRYEAALQLREWTEREEYASNRARRKVRRKSR